MPSLLMAPIATQIVPLAEGCLPILATPGYQPTLRQVAAGALPLPEVAEIDASTPLLHISHDGQNIMQSKQTEGPRTFIPESFEVSCEPVQGEGPNAQQFATKAFRLAVAQIRASLEERIGACQEAATLGGFTVNQALLLTRVPPTCLLASKPGEPERYSIFALLALAVYNSPSPQGTQDPFNEPKDSLECPEGLTAEERAAWIQTALRENLPL